MTWYGVLRMLVLAVVGIGVVLAEGAYAYHRLRNWSGLTTWHKALAIRDVLAALAVLLFVSVLGLAFALAALDDAAH